jgi:ribosomal protein L24
MQVSIRKMCVCLGAGYVTNVVEEARVYSTYAKKNTIDVDGVRLAVKMVSNKSSSTVPPREVINLEMDLWIGNRNYCV